jgi:hypothetical protein
MLGLYQEHCDGFTVKHFHAQPGPPRHDYKLGYTVTRCATKSGQIDASATPHRRFFVGESFI